MGISFSHFSSQKIHESDVHQCDGWRLALPLNWAKKAAICPLMSQILLEIECCEKQQIFKVKNRYVLFRCSDRFFNERVNVYNTWLLCHSTIWKYFRKSLQRTGKSFIVGCAHKISTFRVKELREFSMHINFFES